MALGMGVTATIGTIEPTTGFSEVKDNVGYAPTATYTTTNSFTAGVGYVIAVSSCTSTAYTNISIPGATQLTMIKGGGVSAGSYYVNTYAALFYLKPATTGKLTITVTAGYSSDKYLTVVACPLG